VGGRRGEREREGRGSAQWAGLGRGMGGEEKRGEGWEGREVEGRTVPVLE